jgi:CTP synthase
MAKHIIVCGGVYSGTGKGIACASMAFLLKQRGHSVQCTKFDSYININAGVLAPREHGEVFLTHDALEADLDLGHYERIAGIETNKNSLCTSGMLYKELIEEQEDGKYLGQTIQIIPHLTDKIQEKLHRCAEGVDILVVELGGTVGDIESAMFYEAVRQFKQKNWDNTIIVLVAPIIWVNAIKEFKTKPLQNSVKALQSFGIQPEVLLCRVEKLVSNDILNKISSLTNVPRESIFDCPDVETVYQVPIEFYNRHIDDLLADKLRLKRNGCRIHKYRELVEKYSNCCDMPTVFIGIVGKYENAQEAYLSLREAIYHAGLANDVKTNIVWISAEELENNKACIKELEKLNGLIVPGGFDSRAILGKIKAIQYARENKLPFLGICLGLQCAVIEFAQNVIGLENANSVEFDKATPHPVIHYVEGQEGLKKKVSTMRLGAYDCELSKDSLALELYKKRTISERHRHRFEVNSSYVDKYEEYGFKVTGRNPESDLVEIMELDRGIHPFFIGTQAHPEFKSRLTAASPLFSGLISAAKDYNA